MSLIHRRDQACPKFEARLEDYLEALEAQPSAKPDPSLASHLSACPDCREAFNLACAAGPLVREGALAVPDSLAADPFFASRVGARLRAQSGRSGEFLPLLQSVSLRFMAAALSVGLLLGALSASGYTRAARQAVGRIRGSDVLVISRNSNPAPVNPDDVVIALLSSERGRQPR